MMMKTAIAITLALALAVVLCTASVEGGFIELSGRQSEGGFTFVAPVQSNVFVPAGDQVQAAIEEYLANSELPLLPPGHGGGRGGGGNPAQCTEPEAIEKQAAVMFRGQWILNKLQADAVDRNPGGPGPYQAEGVCHSSLDRITEFMGTLLYTITQAHTQTAVESAIGVAGFQWTATAPANIDPFIFAPECWYDQNACKGKFNTMALCGQNYPAFVDLVEGPCSRGSYGGKGKGHGGKNLAKLRRGRDGKVVGLTEECFAGIVQLLDDSLFPLEMLTSALDNPYTNRSDPMAIACFNPEVGPWLEECAHDTMWECTPYECGVQAFKWLEKHYKVATANERSKHGECAEENMLPPFSGAWVPPCCHSGHSFVSQITHNTPWRDSVTCGYEQAYACTGIEDPEKADKAFQEGYMACLRSNLLSFLTNTTTVDTVDGPVEQFLGNINDIFGAGGYDTCSCFCADNTTSSKGGKGGSRGRAKKNSATLSAGMSTKEATAKSLLLVSGVALIAGTVAFAARRRGHKKVAGEDQDPEFASESSTLM